VEYKIIRGQTVYQLEREVNLALQDGWLVSGGVAVAYSSGFAYHFHQAVVKSGSITISSGLNLESVQDAEEFADALAEVIPCHSG
jgi:hypothetical protein